MTTLRLKSYIEQNPPVKIICVGDRVSRNTTKSNIPVDVSIVDNKIMRKPTEEPMDFKADRTYYVANPHGTLTRKAWFTVRDAVECGRKAKIVVDGEEDLLTLPAVKFAPIGSIVVYGQPRTGLVIIEVTQETKNKITSVVDRMKGNIAKG